MNNWTKDFFDFCEAVGEGIEDFFSEVEQFANEFPESLDEALQDMENTINEEIEIFLNEIYEPLFWEEDEIDNFGSTSNFGFTSKVTPDENTLPACRGCRHYHGYVYGGNLFVCGMHPYGWDDENCPDWEAEQ
ncbi:hypothetical protein FRE64_03940 [Euhalothece natronophila Z-M001]|uniref:Uncharacterized protein n=1 Tax=Euhalothece natronophila Z-M001 TaxID=522448 RepID=A0A5B8NJR4_9CHRO|nr:hypothetical protein [Euhalothece natronophila]QDZ39158.1 hypothetical protein FRE64_03940 [Euhalothece natronophila Z-M001]